MAILFQWLAVDDAVDLSVLYPGLLDFASAVKFGPLLSLRLLNLSRISFICV